MKAAVGDRACPFNALYWDFIAHHDRFAPNTRVAMTVRALDRMDPARLAAIRARAAAFLAATDAWEEV